MIIPAFTFNGQTDCRITKVEAPFACGVEPDFFFETAGEMRLLKLRLERQFQDGPSLRP